MTKKPKIEFKKPSLNPYLAAAIAIHITSVIVPSRELITITFMIWLIAIGKTIEIEALKLIDRYSFVLSLFYSSKSQDEIDKIIEEFLKERRD